MNEHKPDITLENALEQYFDAPSPRGEFLSNLEKSLLSDSTTIPHRSPGWGKRLSSYPAYAILTLVLTLLAALLLVGPNRVLASIQELLRYIPGFGLVEENTTIRILAEPVAETRAGVTLTVKQVVLSAQRTSMSFSVTGLPPEALPAWVVEEKNRICTPVTELRLPDGTRLKGSGGGSSVSNNAYQYIFFFPSIPTNVNEATWLLSCLPETLTGKAPEDWEIPLHFALAPPNFTQMPVILVSPSPAATGAPAAEAAPLSLKQVVETQDGYIFIGSFRQALPAQVVNIFPQIFDANGNLLGYTIPADIPLSHSIDETIEWAYQVRQKEIAWPVTIRFDEVQVACSDINAKLTFDAGPDPQIGQRWKIDQNFFSGPCKLKVDSIQRINNGYLFQISGADKLGQLNPDILGTTPKEFTTRTNPNSTDLDASVIYDQEIPKGLLTVSLSGYALWKGPWQVQWQNPAPQLTPEPTIKTSDARLLWMKSMLDEIQNYKQKVDREAIQPGWTYLTYEQQDILPLNAPRPLPQFRTEEYWNHTNADGIVVESVEYVTTASTGRTLVGFLANGVMVSSWNNETVAKTPSAPSYDLYLVSTLKAMIESGQPFDLSRSETLLEGKQVIRFELKTPYTDQNRALLNAPLSSPAWGQMEIFFFDPESGMLLRYEHYYVLDNGETVLSAITSHREIKTNVQPPLEVLKVLEGRGK